MFRNIVMFPSRLGQPLYGVEQTPKLLRGFLNKENRFYNIKSTTKLDENLFNLYSQLHNMDEKRIVLGGDHSMSIATVADSLNRNPNTKVLWIDAHADMNTPESSVSKNVHGMCLAFLTGLATQRELLNYTFIKNKLDFRNLMYIGLRDIDPFEKKILKEKDVHVITVNELETNFDKTLLEIEKFISYDDIHISFDVDSLDPKVIPCTGTQAGKGISLDTAKNLMDFLIRYPIINMDVTELNLNIGDKYDKITSLQNLFYILEKYID